MNTFGRAFAFSTFGESHGVGIGCVIDGMPAGVCINIALLESELSRRRPNRYGTKRVERDSYEILSGTLNGISTGAPIAVFIKNQNIRSSDYDTETFRPSHGDFTFFHKYGLHDFRGGGRGSARESVARVVAGAFAKMILNELDIELKSGVFSVGDLHAKVLDFEHARSSQIFALDSKIEASQKELIKSVRANGDSIGASAIIVAKGVPCGLGEGLYYKLDSKIADAMMGINGVKAVEIGAGVASSLMVGSDFADEISHLGFLSNNSGGILGGISNGEDIFIKVHFKPTPSIKTPLKTIDTQNRNQIISTKGRHDPCIGIRGSVVCESMLACTLADCLLLNMKSRIENVKKIYKS